MNVKFTVHQQIEIISRQNEKSPVVVEMSQHEIAWLFIELVAASNQNSFNICFKTIENPRFQMLNTTDYFSIVDDMKKCIDSNVINYDRFHTLEMETDHARVVLESTATDLLFRSIYSYPNTPERWFVYNRLILKVINPSPKSFNFNEGT